MIVKTCLLVSDDPDDQLHFTEALNEVSPDTVLVTVLNSKKALDIIKQQKFVPDYLFLDLTMQDSLHNEFSEILGNENGNPRFGTKLIVYGNEEELVISKMKQVSPLEKDFTYTELKDFLKRALDR